MSDTCATWISNSNGQKLLATIHAPASRNANLPAVVLLSPGVKMRVGPGRLYVPLTTALNSLGHLVVRFDFYGLGDSEGELEEALLADVYNNIEVGRYVDDTRCVLAWLRREYGADSFVLGGLCGGAITALLAAEQEPQVVGLLSIGMTVTLASNAATPAKYLTQSELDVRRRGYYRRMMDWHAWWRLITLQSEYGVIWRSLKQLLGRRAANRSVSAGGAAATAGVADQRGNANPLFPRAYLSFLRRGGAALMLFSEKDRLFAEYEEKFRQPFEQELIDLQSRVTTHVVKNANHVLSFGEWQADMVTTSVMWMKATPFAKP